MNSASFAVSLKSGSQWAAPINCVSEYYTVIEKYEKFMCVYTWEAKLATVFKKSMCCARKIWNLKKNRSDLRDRRLRCISRARVSINNENWNFASFFTNLFDFLSQMLWTTARNDLKHETNDRNNHGIDTTLGSDQLPTGHVKSIEWRRRFADLADGLVCSAFETNSLCRRGQEDHRQVDLHHAKPAAQRVALSARLQDRRQRKVH